MAERQLRKRTPGETPADDVDVGFIIDETSPGVGQVVGVYGHNNTRDLVWVEITVANIRRRISLPPGTTVKQRVDLPANRRVALRLDEESKWEWNTTTPVSIAVGRETIAERVRR